MSDEKIENFVTDKKKKKKKKKKTNDIGTTRN